jgi:two-component system sensor histidine kinase YesM
MLNCWIQNKPIRTKILLVFIPFAVIPLIILGIISSAIFKNALTGEAVKNLEYEEALIETNLETMMRQIDNYANIAARGIITIRERVEASGLRNEYLHYNQIKDQINGILQPILPEIESITIIYSDGNIYSTERSFEKQQFKTEWKSMIDAVMDSSNQNILSPMVYHTTLAKDKAVPVMTIGKKLSTINDLEYFAIMLINIPETVFSSLCDKYGDERTEYAIIDTNDIVISSSEKENVAKPYAAASEEKREFLAMKNSTQSGWKIVLKVPYSRFLHGINYIIMTIAAFVLLGIGGIILGANVITNITNAEQKIKSKIQLALLQSQIKPHFLYNALDLIFVLSDSGRSIEARDAVKALADFYRAFLSGGDEIVSIKDEIKNAESYLFLQEKRYHDVFSYYIDMRPEIMDYKIMKMAFQPIIENSIYHGIRKSDRKGTIEIKGIQTGKSTCITIRDDGIGITKDRLLELQKDLRESKPDGKAYGLTSIDKRIKLYFGQVYGISIESEENKGTLVTIRLPAMSEIEED